MGNQLIRDEGIALFELVKNSYDADANRVDVVTLVQALEMPRQCGDLGTTFLSADLNDDCQVNESDIAKLTERWLKDCNYFGTSYILGDLNEDCKIDLIDFARLADKWLNSTEPSVD